MRCIQLFIYFRIWFRTLLLRFLILGLRHRLCIWDIAHTNLTSSLKLKMLRNLFCCWNRLKSNVIIKIEVSCPAEPPSLAACITACYMQSKLLNRLGCGGPNSATENVTYHETSKIKLLLVSIMIGSSVRVMRSRLEF